MSFRELKYLIVDSNLHREPAIGVWLWALNDARRRTHEQLRDLPAAAIDWRSAHSAQKHILAAYQAMDVHEFRRVRRLADYDVTPEWVLHHLMQHEAEHRSEIGGLRASAEQTLLL
jgi:hypothetical protein